MEKNYICIQNYIYTIIYVLKSITNLDIFFKVFSHGNLHVSDIYLAQNFSSAVTFARDRVRDDPRQLLRGVRVTLLRFPAPVVRVLAHLTVTDRLTMMKMRMMVRYSPEYVHARVWLRETITVLRSYTRALSLRPRASFSLARSPRAGLRTRVYELLLRYILHKFTKHI